MAEGQQRVRKVAKVSKKATRVDALELLAKFCYYFPGYTLAQARRLPYKHVALMMKAVREEQAAHYLALTHIAAAPHTKNGKGVSTLSQRFAKAAGQKVNEPIQPMGKSIVLGHDSPGGDAKQ